MATINAADKTRLDSVAAYLRRVDEAPDLAALILMSHAEIEQEAARRYKALDSAGNIYQIQNPALMSYQCSRGASVISRVVPRLLEAELPNSRRAREQKKMGFR